MSRQDGRARRRSPAMPTARESLQRRRNPLLRIDLACAPLLALALALACSTPDPPAPGHGGEVPSPAAQGRLAAIVGRTVELSGRDLRGELVIDGFAVVPNPVTGKGPVVLLRRPGAEPGPRPFLGEQGEAGWWYLPVLTDGDVADLVLRATGAADETISLPTSALYVEHVGH